MGATTYRLMSGFAAQTPDEAGMTGLTAQPKVVFSSTLQGPLSWANTELVGGDAVDAVRAMKQETGRPLRTLGSRQTPAGQRRRPRVRPAAVGSSPGVQAGGQTSVGGADDGGAGRGRSSGARSAA